MASPLGPVYILKELCRYAAILLRRECCSLCPLCLVEPGEHGTWGHECRRICRDPPHGFWIVFGTACLAATALLLAQCQAHVLMS